MQRGGGRYAGLDQLGDLLADQPVGQRAARVRADVHRHARVVRRAHGLVPPLVQPSHMGGPARELPLAAVGELREEGDVDERGHDRDPALREQRDRLLRQPGGVLDAVDAGLDQRRQGLLGEAVRGDARAEPVRLGDGGLDLAARPAGRQVAGLAVDPVTDELDPAVAVAGLPRHVGHEVLRLDLMRVVADVAAGTGDVPARADDARQVVPVVDPAGVGGRAGVAQQQRARVAIGDRLLLAGRGVHRAVLVEADVAVGVDQAGQCPALDDGGLARAARPFVRDAPVDHPQFVAYVLRADQHPPLDVQHRHPRHPRHPRRHSAIAHGGHCTSPGARVRRAPARAARGSRGPSGLLAVSLPDPSRKQPSNPY